MAEVRVDERDWWEPGDDDGPPPDPKWAGPAEGDRSEEHGADLEDGPGLLACDECGRQAVLNVAAARRATMGWRIPLWCGRCLARPEPDEFMRWGSATIPTPPGAA